MKIVYANEGDFHKYADPDNPRRPHVPGGVFRNANAWDGRPEFCDEVLIDPDCNMAAAIAAAYENFEWIVPGDFPGLTKKRHAKITMLNTKSVAKARKEAEKVKAAQIDQHGDPGDETTTKDVS